MQKTKMDYYLDSQHEVLMDKITEFIKETVASLHMDCCIKGTMASKVFVNLARLGFVKIIENYH